MGKIVETLRELGIGGDSFVYLNYEDTASVWHISDDYIDEALTQTRTAQVLASVLATRGITIYSRYEEDVLEIMRDAGLLEDYDREGTFEDYLTDTIQREAYEHDLLTISTERHDHKRGTCEIATNLKVRASDLYSLNSAADTFVSPFDVVVQTKDGLLTLGV
tara:strand:- start:2809 stop:3297 length:489 start_codon:yes stop_codon:yes gene_type:complete